MSSARSTSASSSGSAPGSALPATIARASRVSARARSSPPERAGHGRQPQQRVRVEQRAGRDAPARRGRARATAPPPRCRPWRATAMPSASATTPPSAVLSSPRSRRQLERVGGDPLTARRVPGEDQRHRPRREPVHMRQGQPRRGEAVEDLERGPRVAGEDQAHAQARPSVRLGERGAAPAPADEAACGSDADRQVGADELGADRGDGHGDVLATIRQSGPPTGRVRRSPAARSLTLAIAGRAGRR